MRVITSVCDGYRFSKYTSHLSIVQVCTKVQAKMLTIGVGFFQWVPASNYFGSCALEQENPVIFSILSPPVSVLCVEASIS